MARLLCSWCVLGTALPVAGLIYFTATCPGWLRCCSCWCVPLCLLQVTKDSRTPVEGAQQLAALMHAAERLSAAEKRHQPAALRNATTQVIG